MYGHNKANNALCYYSRQGTTYDDVIIKKGDLRTHMLQEFLPLLLNGRGPPCHVVDGIFTQRDDNKAARDDGHARE